MKRFMLSPKKLRAAQTPPLPDPSDAEVAPELVPIVTLLLAQTHRRYHEGILMIYNDLNGDGNPAERQWKEVYGVLTGNQLAYWDAQNLARFRDKPEQLHETSSKPNYLNFTDAVFNGMAVLPAAKQQLENVIIVLTTLKNRYILQLKLAADMTRWIVALRLASFEYLLLQEAYTGALLLAKGLQLSDIRTILAAKRFNHEEWVKIRYGLGMAWKRCFAVIEPSSVKRNKLFVPGRVLLYDLQNVKKKSLLGVITAATLVTAVYPQLPFFIDKSTIMKLEGHINFRLPSAKKNDARDSQETALFVMPEEHSSVPGFDTLIRFLVPLYDAFGLYGRPKRLKADRVDIDSLVFGLPTLPHVHYLTIEDLLDLGASPQLLTWDAAQWHGNIKRVLAGKMSRGYEGCGLPRGVSGALSSLSSPRLGSADVSSPRVGSFGQAAQGPGPVTPSRSQFVDSFAQQRGFRDSPVSQAKAQPRAPVMGQSLSMNQSTSSGWGQPGTGYGSSLGPDSALSPESFPPASQESLVLKDQRTLRVDPAGDPRALVQLAEIYQKYLTIETPLDRFGDRNKILNGDVEDFDEEVLPTLMRKKSLMHGPYPTNDDKLLRDSGLDDSGLDESGLEESGSLDESDEESGSSTGAGGLLAVPRAYENRNSSHLSVQSPMTQYHEFNQQFSKAVDRGPSRLQYNSDEDVANDLQGMRLRDEPAGQPSRAEDRPVVGVQKSKASTNLSKGLENKPRYIQMPGSSQGPRVGLNTQPPPNQGAPQATHQQRQGLGQNPQLVSPSSQTPPANYAPQGYQGQHQGQNPGQHQGQHQSQNLQAHYAQGPPPQGYRNAPQGQSPSKVPMRPNQGMAPMGAPMGAPMQAPHGSHSNHPYQVRATGNDPSRGPPQMGQMGQKMPQMQQQMPQMQQQMPMQYGQPVARPQMHQQPSAQSIRLYDLQQQQQQFQAQPVRHAHPYNQIQQNHAASSQEFRSYGPQDAQAPPQGQPRPQNLPQDQYRRY